MSLKCLPVDRPRCSVINYPSYKQGRHLHLKLLVFVEVILNLLSYNQALYILVVMQIERYSIIYGI